MLTRVLTPLTILTLFVSGALQAQSDKVVTSKAKLPFAGSFFDSAAGETVNISGLLDVVTHITIPQDPTAPIKLYVEGVLPADVDARGASTGFRYIANGANALQVFIPTEPIIPPDPIFQYTVKAPGNFPPQPLFSEARTALRSRLDTAGGRRGRHQGSGMRPERLQFLAQRDCADFRRWSFLDFE